MKILHITTALPPEGKGGQEKCAMKIINHFQHTFDIYVLIKKGKNPKGNYQIQTFNLKFRIKNLLSLIKNLSGLISSVDLIHFHYPAPYLPEIPIIPVFLFLNFFFKKRYIVHIHIMTKFKHFLWKLFFISYPFKKLIKYLYNHSELNLAPTKLTIKDLNVNFNVPLNKIKHVPYGVSDIFYNLTQNNKKKDFKKIIYVGQLVARKRVNRLINAIKELPENYILDIYGDGIEFKNLIELSKKCERIKFYGFISNELQLTEAFKNANLMVLPSLHEEMPLSILEAIASRVPVLCSDIKPVRAIFQNNIYYFKEINNLKQEIVRITNRNNTSLLEKAYIFALNYTWKKHFESIRISYIEAMNNGNYK